MAGLEDIIRSSAPGGNVGKPLMLALLALLASGACLEAAVQDVRRAQGHNRRPTKAVAVFSEDWAGCWTSCRRVD